MGTFIPNGTDDLDVIELIENYAKRSVDAKVASETDKELQKRLPEINKKANTEALRKVRREYRFSEGTRFYDLSPFISEEVKVNGQLINRNKFFPDMLINDPYSENVRLYFDDTTDQWLVRVKSSLPKIISRFVVIGCLIVDASGSGSCRAYVVFLKGEANPLIFWGGIVDAAELRRQTQFHQKGFSYARKDLYHESFIRALSMCRAVGFLTLPKHAGWNVMPDGKLLFVSSQFNIPELCKLFEDSEKKHMRNIFQDIVLEKTERTLESVAIDYKRLFPEDLPIKIGTVISTLSRLLPHFYKEGLVQDRLFVVETSDDVTVKAMTAAIQNRHHNKIETLFSSERITEIKNELQKYIDCAVTLRHSINICSKHDFEKLLKFLYELLQNGYADDDTNRLVPVLFIDNAGIIPEEFKIHQLTINDRILIDDTKQIQRIVGEINYYIVKIVECNPDAVKQRIKSAVVDAKKMISTIPKRSQSSSAVMFISTTLLLKEVNILNEADVQSVLQWLCLEAKERTSMGQCTRKVVSNTLSTSSSPMR